MNHILAHKIKSRQASIDFIFAGKAIVTFKNVNTGNRYTFKITHFKKVEDKFMHFVKVMYGSDNINDYSYIGTIFDKKDFVHTKKSKVTIEDVRFRTFRYVFNNLLMGTLPNYIEIFHEGKCGKCGRTLTVPESIKIGLGPVCRDYLDKEKSNQINLNI